MIVLAALCWALLGVFLDVLLGAGFTRMQVVVIRVSISSVALGAYMLVFDRSLFRVKLRDIWCFIGTGVCSLAVFNWCYFTAIETTSIAVAVVLLYTAPAFVMLFSVALFGEMINARKIAALAMTLAGCVCAAGIICGGELRVSPFGFAAGIGSGAGYALYSIFGRYAIRRGYSPITISEYTFLFALAATLPLSRIWEAAPAFAAPGALAGALAISLGSTVLPYVLYTKGLEGLDTGTAAMIATVEPAGAALLSAAIYGESLFGLKGAGVLLMIGAVLMLNMRPRLG